MTSKLNREDKIEAIIEKMLDWDSEALLQWAIETRQDMLEQATDEIVDKEYEEDCVE